MPEGGGCRCGLRAARWRQPPDLRRLRDRGHSPHPRPPRGRRRSRRPGLREGDRESRGRVRHVRARRDEPDHADLRRDDGFGPSRVHHRPGAHRAARHRRLSGGRHARDHDSDRQALVHDPGPARDPARDPRGVLHRALRPPRPGARRHPAGSLARRDRVRAGDRRASARVSADDGGQPEADPPGGEGSGGGAAPGDLRRRRRRQRERLGGARRVRDERPLPGHLHADGSRGVPGAERAAEPIRNGWECPACMARARRTTRWTRRT